MYAIDQAFAHCQTRRSRRANQSLDGDTKERFQLLSIKFYNKLTSPSQSPPPKTSARKTSNLLRRFEKLPNAYKGDGSPSINASPRRSQNQTTTQSPRKNHLDGGMHVPASLLNNINTKRFQSKPKNRAQPVNLTLPMVLMKRKGCTRPAQRFQQAHTLLDIDDAQNRDQCNNIHIPKLNSKLEQLSKSGLNAPQHIDMSLEIQREKWGSVEAASSHLEVDETSALYSEKAVSKVVDRHVTRAKKNIERIKSRFRKGVSTHMMFVTDDRE